MAKDDNSSLILIILGLGALVLMSNSSGSEKTKILQKRTKDIEKGVPKETAVQTNPLPHTRNERNILEKDLRVAMETYRDLDNWERQNVKVVAQNGLPDQIWARVVELRSYMVEVGIRGNLHFSHSADSGVDAIFWGHWRAVWTGIVHIAQRHTDRFNRMAALQQMHRPVNIDDPTDGVDYPMIDFVTIPEQEDLPEPLSLEEFRAEIQNVYQAIDQVWVTNQQLNILNYHNYPPGPEETDDWNDSAFVTGNPTRDSEDEDAEYTNEQLGGAQSANLRAPSRKGLGLGEHPAVPNFVTQLGGSTPGKKKSKGYGPEKTTTGAGKGHARYPSTHDAASKDFETNQGPKTNPDKAPAKAPTKKKVGPWEQAESQIPDEIQEASENSIQADFNQSGTAVREAVVSAMEEQEKEFQGGDDTARDKSLGAILEAQIDVNMDTNYEEFKRQAESLAETVRRLISLIAPTKTERAECKAAFYTLQKLVPFGASNEYMFMGVYFKLDTEPGFKGKDVKFSAGLKKQIRGMPEYTVWENSFRGVSAHYYKWKNQGAGKETDAKAATATEAGLDAKGGGKRAKKDPKGGLR